MLADQGQKVNTGVQFLQVADRSRTALSVASTLGPAAIGLQLARFIESVFLLRLALMLRRLLCLCRARRT